MGNPKTKKKPKPEKPNCESGNNIVLYTVGNGPPASIETNVSPIVDLYLVRDHKKEAEQVKHWLEVNLAPGSYEILKKLIDQDLRVEQERFIQMANHVYGYSNVNPFPIHPSLNGIVK